MMMIGLHKYDPSPRDSFVKIKGRQKLRDLQ